MTTHTKALTLFLSHGRRDAEASYLCIVYTGQGMRYAWYIVRRRSRISQSVQRYYYPLTEEQISKPRTLNIPSQRGGPCALLRSDISCLPLPFLSQLLQFYNSVKMFEERWNRPQKFRNLKENIWRISCCAIPIKMYIAALSAGSAACNHKIVR